MEAPMPRVGKTKEENREKIQLVAGGVDPDIQPEETAIAMGAYGRNNSVGFHNYLPYWKEYSIVKNPSSKNSYRNTYREYLSTNFQKANFQYTSRISRNFTSKNLS